MSEETPTGQVNVCEECGNMSADLTWVAIYGGPDGDMDELWCPACVLDFAEAVENA